MYAVARNVTAFVTRNVKSFPTVLLALVIGLALTFGCASSSKSMDFSNELFQGLEQELEQEVVAIKGDAYNHTKHFIVFGIFKPTNFPSDPVFKSKLEPGERVYFKLKPGKYIMAAMVFEKHSFGNVLKQIKYPFEIFAEGNEFGFGFWDRTNERQA